MIGVNEKTQSCASHMCNKYIRCLEVSDWSEQTSPYMEMLTLSAILAISPVSPVSSENCKCPYSCYYSI